MEMAYSLIHLKLHYCVLNGEQTFFWRRLDMSDIPNISLGQFECIELRKSKQVIQLSWILQATQVFTTFGFSEEFLLVLNQPLYC